MSELELWNELGNIYYFAGAYDEAIRTYNKVIKLDPGSGQSYSNLASILVTQERLADSIPMFRKAIELTDEKINRAFLWKQLGDALRKLDDYAHASVAYQEAIKLVPEDATLQASLAEVDLASQTHPSESKAESDREELPSLVSETPNAASSDSEASIQTEPEPMETESAQVPESASEPSSKLLDISQATEPGNACWMFIDNEPEKQGQEHSSDTPEPSPVFLGGRILSDPPVEIADVEISSSSDQCQIPDPIPAEASEQTASDDIPGLVAVVPAEVKSSDTQKESGVLPNVSPRGLLRLGILHWRKEEYERSIRFLQFALISADRTQDQILRALCHISIARVETDLGKIEAAIRAYQSAANLAPENIFPWNNLGNLNCMLDRYEDARAAFQKSIEHNPKDPIGWNGLGDVYHKLGRFEDAIAAYQLGNVFEGKNIDEDVFITFEQTVDSDQENPSVWNEAGDIYFSIDAYEDAMDSYRKAIQLDPDDPTFQANLACTALALEQTKRKNEPSSFAAPVEFNETLQLPKNFVDEMKTPKPEETIVIKTNPEIAAPVRSFDEEKTFQHTKEMNNSRPGSNASGSNRVTGFVMQQASDLPVASTSPETGAPYWMFKDIKPQEDAGPSGTCFLPAITETVVTNVKPAPGFEAQTPHKPAFSAAQLLTGADQDHINVLVQMTPRPVRPAWSEEIIKTPAVDHDWGKASLDEDARSRQVSLAGPRNDAPAAQNIKPVCPETKPAAQALNSRENDISACLRVTEINPANDRAWDALGSKYDAAGLYSEAIAAYEQAISLCPQKEVYYYHLGIAFAYQMRYDKAIQALEKVLALDPKFMLAHCALAGYYRKLGKEAEAREHVAIARPGMETETEYNQSCFESISGDADRALELLATAFEKQQVQPAMVQNDPDLDFIRTDPRFEALLAKNGIFRQ